MSTHGLGFAGRVARAFQTHPLTPVLALAALLLGFAALMITPREEKPQIDVTVANVIVPFPGAEVHAVEKLVASPLEQQLTGIVKAIAVLHGGAITLDRSARGGARFVLQLPAIVPGSA